MRLATGTREREPRCLSGQLRWGAKDNGCERRLSTTKRRTVSDSESASSRLLRACSNPLHRYSQCDAPGPPRVTVSRIPRTLLNPKGSTMSRRWSGLTPCDFSRWSGRPGSMADEPTCHWGSSEAPDWRLSSRTLPQPPFRGRSRLPSRGPRGVIVSRRSVWQVGAVSDAPVAREVSSRRRPLAS